MEQKFTMRLKAGVYGWNFDLNGGQKGGQYCARVFYNKQMYI